MSTFEELKEVWGANQEPIQRHTPYDNHAFQNIVKSRTRKNMNKYMHYFWGALFLQILVYALLSHVILKYGHDLETLLLGICGVLLFLPFTIVMMKKFKRMAIVRPQENNSGTSLYEYVTLQYSLLQSFYSFKKRYELLLVPLSTAIGVFLTFKLFVPGGAEENITGLVTTFTITIFSMIASIRMENRKHFEQPLRDLNQLLKEFKDE